MPDPQGVAIAAAAALGVATLLAAIGVRASRGDASLAGVALLAGCVWGAVVGLGLLRALPRVPPSSALDRLLLILLPATLAIELEVAGGWLERRWLTVERAFLALVATPVLLHGSVWLDGRGPPWPAFLAAAFFLWAAWEGIEGQVAATGDRVVVGVTAAALVTAGVAIGAGGWMRGAVVPVPLAAALVGALVGGFAGGAAGIAALAGSGFVALFGTAVVGCCFGRLSVASAILLLVAPLAAGIPAGIAWFLPVSGPERVLQSARYRVALAAVPLVAVLLVAKADTDALLRQLSAAGGPAAIRNVRQDQPSLSREATSSAPADR